MKNIVFLFCLVNLVSDSYSQNFTDCYLIKYVNFSNNNSPLFQHEYIVSGNKDVSISYQNSINSINKQTKDIVEGNLQVKVYTPFDTTQKLYKNFNSKIMYFQVGVDLFFKRRQTFSDTVGICRWKLESEKKLIDSFVCQKATSSFRGRKYIAWFSSSIPINNGPWKIDGLPGLILEVYDEEKIVYWRISKLIYYQCQLEIFKGDVEGTFLEFHRIFKEKFNKMKKALESNSNDNNPNCTSCKQSVKSFKLNTPEKLEEDY